MWNKYSIKALLRLCLWTGIITYFAFFHKSDGPENFQALKELLSEIYRSKVIIPLFVSGALILLIATVFGLRVTSSNLLDVLKDELFSFIYTVVAVSAVLTDGLLIISLEPNHQSDLFFNRLVLVSAILSTLALMVVLPWCERRVDKWLASHSEQPPA